MQIGKHLLGLDKPTFFIAEIGSNHEGSLDRAVKLIHLAAKAGADAVKFQHFRAEYLISDEGFKSLICHRGHQADWDDSIFNTFKKYEVPWEWTPVLAEEAEKAGVEFLSTPYDLEEVDHLDPFVPAFKIGSGDIDYFELLEKVASKGKPVILATGASTLEEIEKAFPALRDAPELALLQCNTNYSGNANFKYLNLRVIRTFEKQYFLGATGLSDHTHGHVAVLGAVAMGARIIEKHFTDDNKREGPDHPFAMAQMDFYRMVQDVRSLELALGDGVKRVEENEQETRIIQRRGTWNGKRLRPANG